MTMMSFRLDPNEAEQLDRIAGALKVDRSEVVRTALRRYVAELAAEEDVVAWERLPMTPDDAFLAVEAWLPAEDWSDWEDATR